MHSSKSPASMKRVLRNFSKGSYIIIVKGHAFALIDGIVHENIDDGIPMGKTVNYVFKVV